MTHRTPSKILRGFESSLRKWFSLISVITLSDSTAVAIDHFTSACKMSTRFSRICWASYTLLPTKSVIRKLIPSSNAKTTFSCKWLGVDTQRRDHIIKSTNPSLSACGCIDALGIRWTWPNQRFTSTLTCPSMIQLRTRWPGMSHAIRETSSMTYKRNKGVVN